ncbi:MAG: hypothetical protein MJA29_12350 [Candidatus Omnitrophica bacterium]|nr:hypothetical protein [Candidatus Omnitrophota bacterium]
MEHSSHNQAERSLEAKKEEIKNALTVPKLVLEQIVENRAVSLRILKSAVECLNRVVKVVKSL